VDTPWIAVDPPELLLLLMLLPLLLLVELAGAVLDPEQPVIRPLIAIRLAMPGTLTRSWLNFMSKTSKL
jgi:hypothetical protein